MNLKVLNINITPNDNIAFNKNFLIYNFNNILNLNNNEKIELGDYKHFCLIGDFLCVSYIVNNSKRDVLYDKNMSIIAEGDIIKKCNSTNNIKDLEIEVINGKEISILNYKGKIIINYVDKDHYYYNKSINRFYYYYDDGVYLTDINKNVISEKYESFEGNDNNYIIAKKDDKYGVIDVNGNVVIPFDNCQLIFVSSNLDIPLFICKKKYNKDYLSTLLINIKNDIICEIDSGFSIGNETKNIYKDYPFNFKTIDSLIFAKDKMLLYYSVNTRTRDRDENFYYKEAKGSKSYIINNQDIINMNSNIRYIEKTVKNGKVTCYDVLKNKEVSYYRYRDKERLNTTYTSILQLSPTLYKIYYYICYKDNGWKKEKKLGYGYTTDLSAIPDTPFLKEIIEMKDYFCIKDMNDKYGLISKDGKLIIKCDFDMILVSNYDRVLFYDNKKKEFYIND